MDSINWGLVFSPACIWVLIPLSAIVGGLLLQALRLITKHREHMAMIEAGLHPDHPDSARIYRQMAATQLPPR